MLVSTSNYNNCPIPENMKRTNSFGHAGHVKAFGPLALAAPSMGAQIATTSPN